jgi:glycosyltransferase involved in cell wall biosynthesis
VLDYKAAGLATIASGHGKHPPTLRHGVTGWIVPPCDEDALAGAMAALLADPELCQRLGQAARQEAEECHTWEHTVDRLLRVFQQVLAQKSDSIG